MPPSATPDWLLLALAAACWLSATVGLTVAVRLWRGLPVLPYQPRRQVPWQGIDLLAVMVFHLVLGMAAYNIACLAIGPDLVQPIESGDGAREGTEHNIAKMLVGAEPWLIAIGVFAVVVVTPIAEEFIYRVLLQGWLEAALRRWRRRFRALRWRLLPAVAGPIIISSLLFALLHYRVATPAHHRYYYLGILLAGMATNLLTVTFAAAWTHLRVGATAVDWGWAPQRFWSDARLGAVAFLAISAPLYLTQIGLGLLLPKYLAPDPLTIFLFALLLGTLYHRTHRGVPAMVAHALLNATSLLFLWLQPLNPQ
jgi:membrane protease YdiL (CAAX protease family)